MRDPEFHEELALTIQRLDGTRASVVTGSPTRRPRTQKQNGGLEVSEPVDGGEKSGVVYLGRNSFKMKAGVTVTPPAGTPEAPRAAPTPRGAARRADAAASVEDGAAARHADAAAVIEDGAAARHAASLDGVIQLAAHDPGVLPDGERGVAGQDHAHRPLPDDIFRRNRHHRGDRPLLAARAPGMRERRAGERCRVRPPGPGLRIQT